MSGIAGIVHRAGRQAAADDLQPLMVVLGERGPDGTACRQIGSAVLGHSLLRTDNAGSHPQVFTLDNQAWITADARIDGQEDLRRKIRAHREIPCGARDSELILHAYLAWGERCVEHLIGDFAFAIWDTTHARLFCARDHFGVKPFFYSSSATTFVLSNTLRAVRAHREVDSALDEAAIGDFLLFDRSQDPTATAFRGIRRLAPAHCLSLDANGLEIRAYWSLPRGAPVHYRNAGDYVDRFRELLGMAVDDRLRTDRVAIMMSGGLDSSCVAAVARTRLGPAAIRAKTAVYDRLMPDEERHYSRLVGAHLGIPVDYRPVDDYRVYESYGELHAYLPEPFHDPLAALGRDLACDAATHARVVLTGWDGDAILSESPRPYFRHLLRERQWRRLARAGAQYVARERRLVPASVRLALMPWRRAANSPETFPTWINADFARRSNLRERFEALAQETASSHPFRPAGFRRLDFLMRYSSFFDRSDPGCTGLAIEFRHPLLDVRLVEMSLELPPYPWCFAKEMLRRAMAGALPDAVLRRPKTPVSGSPHLEAMKRPDAAWIDNFTPSVPTAAFVDGARLKSARRSADAWEAWVNLRPLSLDLWLRNNASVTP